MTALSAYIEGARRVASAPIVVAGMLVVSLFFALPAAFFVRSMLAHDLGHSGAAETVTDGVDWQWWQEYSSQTSGLARTFTPRVIGFAAPLGNLSDLADKARPPASTWLLVAGWLVLWSFLSGGILDRYARDRRLGAHGFFMAAGMHFFRFLRLAALATPLYFVLAYWVHGWLLDDTYRWLTRTTTVERNAFVVRAALYAALGVIVVGITILFDYARIRIVVEDRHSAVGALVAAARFLRRHPAVALRLYALNALGFLAILGLYWLSAPPAPAMWLGWLVGQLYVVARLWVKLQFYASQTALFQGKLAHAGYVARAPASWPDSPAAEVARRA